MAAIIHFTRFEYVENVSADDKCKFEWVRANIVPTFQRFQEFVLDAYGYTDHNWDVHFHCSNDSPCSCENDFKPSVWTTVIKTQKYFFACFVKRDERQDDVTELDNHVESTLTMRSRESPQRPSSQPMALLDLPEGSTWTPTPHQPSKTNAPTTEDRTLSLGHKRGTQGNDTHDRPTKLPRLPTGPLPQNLEDKLTSYPEYGETRRRCVVGDDKKTCMAVWAQRDGRGHIIYRKSAYDLEGNRLPDFPYRKSQNFKEIRFLPMYQPYEFTTGEATRDRIAAALDALAQLPPALDSNIVVAGSPVPNNDAPSGTEDGPSEPEDAEILEKRLPGGRFLVGTLAGTKYAVGAGADRVIPRLKHYILERDLQGNTLSPHPNKRPVSHKDVRYHGVFARYQDSKEAQRKLVETLRRLSIGLSEPASNSVPRGASGRSQRRQLGEGEGGAIYAFPCERCTENGFECHRQNDLQLLCCVRCVEDRRRCSHVSGPTPRPEASFTFPTDSSPSSPQPAPGGIDESYVETIAAIEENFRSSIVPRCNGILERESDNAAEFEQQCRDILEEIATHDLERWDSTTLPPDSQRKLDRLKQQARFWVDGLNKFVNQQDDRTPPGSFVSQTLRPSSNPPLIAHSLPVQDATRMVVDSEIDDAISAEAGEGRNEPPIRVKFIFWNHISRSLMIPKREYFSSTTTVREILKRARQFVQQDSSIRIPGCMGALMNEEEIVGSNKGRSLATFLPRILDPYDPLSSDSGDDEDRSQLRFETTWKEMPASNVNGNDDDDEVGFY